MTRVVVLDPIPPTRIDQMRALLPEGWELSAAASRSAEDQLAAITGANFAITGDMPVTAQMMAAEGLKGVHKWGVGYDNIDCDAAREHGVRVMRTTGSNAVSVAETTLGLMLALNRGIVRGHLGVLNGKWLKGELSQSSMRLTGKTVGIVGMGYIGKALARLLAGFGCTLLYTKPSQLSAEEETALRLRFATLDELLATSDVIALHCTLNESTRGMINRETLARMKPGSILINTARGGVVVEADLAAAVEAGHLRGAAVDVFATEPVEAGNPLVGLDRVIVTPHVGAISADSFVPNVSRMIANMAAVNDGRQPPEIDVVV